MNIKSESRYFAVGGSANLWGGINTHFDKIEMIDKISSKNLWPINSKKLFKLYAKLKNYNFDMPIIKKKKSIFDFKERVFCYKKKPVNFKDFLDYKNIDLALNCKVININTKKKNFWKFKQEKKF